MDRSMKLAVSQRLQREGRWPAASKFKEETRLRLRDEGIKRAEATERAWRATAERFPPIPESSIIYCAAARFTACLGYWREHRDDLPELRRLLWVDGDSPAVRRHITRALRDPVAFVQTPMHACIESRIAELEQQQQTPEVEQHLVAHRELLSEQERTAVTRVASEFASWRGRRALLRR